MLNVLSSAAMKGFTCFEPSPFPRVDDIFQAWPAAAEEQSILPGEMCMGQIIHEVSRHNK